MSSFLKTNMSIVLLAVLTYDVVDDENDEHHFRPLHDVVALLVVLEQSDRGERVERDHTTGRSKLKGQIRGAS